MIQLNRFHDLMLQLQHDVNELLVPGQWTLKDGVWIDSGQFNDEAEWNDTPVLGKKIDQVLVSATEAHIIKKVKDKNGIVLASKMPDTDSEIRTADEYLENNHCLIFLFEKINPGSINDVVERQHYAKIQDIMKLVKEWILNHGLNSSEDDGGETLSKTIRTEWEYQIYGGFNGLSISFDLKDFSL